ncbi:hypothetical protein BD779DRAFT_1608562 [Infundibulicybe gibba]|nr:hypothetical protein BD779DRAFT_1608562 [Infundibulicybe gibba]
MFPPVIVFAFVVMSNISYRFPSPVRRERDVRPTPAPTGAASLDKTVHILSGTDFSLLLPKNAGELVSDAEVDGVRFCAPESAATGVSGCSNVFQDGFIRAAALEHSTDNLQFDVRYPNGALCTFGGYEASFIELVEPSAGRFCMRCCANANDQDNCNSHQDRLGCMQAIPGIYQFPGGISCID